MPAGQAPRRPRPRRLSAIALLAAGAGAIGIAGCAGARQGGAPAVAPAGQGSEHGLVLTRSTARYLMVMAIVAPERVYAAAEVAATRPAAGDVVVRGRPAPTDGIDVRRVEVHVYSLESGQPVTEATPQLTLVDRTAGTSADIDATLVHDIVIGTADAHFGTNTPLPAGHAFTLHVALGDDDTEFSGVLP